MDNTEKQGWGTWNFSVASQEKLLLFKNRLQCSSSNPSLCRNLNNKLWRIVIGNVVDTRTESKIDSNLSYSTVNEAFANDVTTVAVGEGNDLVSCNYQISEAIKNDELEISMRNVSPDMQQNIGNPDAEGTIIGNDEELLECVAEMCDLLKKGPVKGLTSKFINKDVNHVLAVMKGSLSNEESIANLILSICPPMEEDLVEQSRWAPTVYQHIILPEVLERMQPVPRFLSEAISQIASCFPDSCVQFLCLPLLSSPDNEKETMGLSQPVIEILNKIIEESLPVQQRILLFRALFKGLTNVDKSTTQENIFPILLMLAETQGAFNSADAEFISHLIDWLELSSLDYFSNIKFTKLLIAILKGIVQEMESKREGKQQCLSAEGALKLKSIVSQNRTFLKKIAEKFLKSIAL